MDIEKKILVGGKNVITKDVLKVLIPILEEAENEWTGESMISYIKYKLGLRVSQYKDKEYGD